MAEQGDELERARKRLTDAVTVGGFRIGALAARMMPGPVAVGAASSIAFTASLANSSRRRMMLVLSDAAPPPALSDGSATTTGPSGSA